MKRKMTAVILIVTLLISLSPTVAADESSAVPTVEEILSDYHKKAFEAQMQSETDTYAARSRGGSAKSLEQETVDILTEAGYEAYNVTAGNYTALENDLNTDFDSMGMDTSGSYIIVITGDDSIRMAGDGMRSDDIVQEGESSHAYFEHIYNGRTFLLRFLTVTADNDSNYAQDNAYPLIEEEDPTITSETILDGILSATVAVATESNIYLTAINEFASLLGISVSSFFGENPQTFKSLALNGGTSWSRTFTQVYNETTSTWQSYLYVEYANTVVYCSGLYFNKILQRHTQIPSNQEVNRVYSANYGNMNWRKDKAIEKYLQGEPGSFYYDKTGNMKYYYDGVAVIIHYDSF